MNDLTRLRGIGPKTVLKLNKLNIFSANDLLLHYPRHYLDFTNITTVSRSLPEDNVSLNLSVVDFKNIYTPTKKNLQIVTAKDRTGLIKLIWLNQPYLSQTIKVDRPIMVAGQISLYHNQKTIFFPFISEDEIKKIYPVYPQTKGLTSSQIGKIISQNIDTLLSEVEDFLPTQLICQNNLLPKKEALYKIHQPLSLLDINNSQKRLSVDELLPLHLNSVIWKKRKLSQKTSHQFITNQTINNKIDTLIKNFPFTLTSDQKKVWRQVKTDLLSPLVTNRLIQGDVGSGKTVIAILSCFLAYLNQKLSIVIVPTQILAHQHYNTFKKFLPKVPITCITSATKNKDRIDTQGVIIATQAIFFRQSKLVDQVGLVIIDEQHKFGVNQRNVLFNKKDPPHCLTMTATPIPRTVKLTLLNNLDVSSIKTRPKQRLKIKTYLIYPQKQLKCYQYLADQVKARKSQVFVVCPFIQESKFFDTPSAQTTYKQLVHLFPKLRIGLLHSQTKDRKKVYDDFSNHLIDILVSTPIIEVGIDVKMADHVVINSADRFGLSQIHQLRGRVGRGDRQAYCYLFTSSQNPKTLKRLEFIKKTDDCFKISKYDLADRGPGTIFSTLQHGFPQLKLANLNNVKQNLLVRSISKDLMTNYPINVEKILKTLPPSTISQN